MFDIDALQPFSRHNPLREVYNHEQAVADAEREMTEATMRWIDARMRLEALRAQSRPIPVSPTTLTMSTDFWDHRHRVMAGNEAKIARANGQIEYLHEDDGA